jgi:hypothetical protein
MSTSISPCPEFLYAAQNDPRTKAVALYVEPGGYYEKMALEMIQQRRFGFNKPIVVCVTGRWKKDIARSCGHAGALAGGGRRRRQQGKLVRRLLRRAGLRSRPSRGLQSGRAGLVDPGTSPTAMRAMFAKMDEQQDFAGEGDLELKLWLATIASRCPSSTCPWSSRLPPTTSNSARSTSKSAPSPCARTWPTSPAPHA